MLENAFFSDFCGNLEFIHTFKFPLSVFVSIKTKELEEWLNRMENLSRVFQKQRKKKHMKRLSFITQFKIEFLLPFTSCRKVFGKMLGPAQLSVRKRLYSGARKRH